MSKAFEVNKHILNQIPQIVLDYRRQHIYDGSSQMIELTENIDQLISLLSPNSFSDYIVQISQIMPSILSAQAEGDYLFVADVLEDDLRAWSQSLQLHLQNDIYENNETFSNNMKALKKQNESLYNKLNDIKLEEQFIICMAINGDLNCKVKSNQGSLYLHSMINPRWAAQELVDSIWEEGYEKYYVWGLGMGYHVKALLNKADCYEVSVMESRLELIAMALRTLDFSKEIEEKRLIIRWNESEIKLLQEITAEENEYVLVYNPSLRLVHDRVVKDTLEEFSIKVNATYEHGTDMLSNFRKLQAKNLSPCEEIDVLINGKTVVIVAGGPSVDEELASIKECREQITVFAVGRIVGRLQREGVKPDIIIVTDPSKEIEKQFKEVCYDDVPLIMLSTAYYGVEEAYKGPVYLAYQKGYPQAEKIADEKGYVLIETGGSVTTTAMDIAIKFGAERIVFVGLDLAYTHGNSHAQGADGKKIVNSNELRRVEGIQGNILNTSKILDCYRKWIERRILREKTLTFYNTGSGAHISGTIECDLKTAIDRKEGGLCLN